ncbi:DUF1553 domain-containing protein [Salmonirosea aquatica]|uniref:DUF1553 domain-containing protein n=1 Tax=Salmonirosea aquatica TaxID=2654236 RepID=A0A7C9BIU9_9BACT|nr:DUF1553 domain-containing protein [Cytophagaceae bacterium SJW1-29]
MLIRIFQLLTAAFMVFSCRPALPEDVSAAMDQVPDAVDYNRDVKPILSDKCFACHGPDQKKQKAGLRLDVAAHAYGALPESPGQVAIKPGNLRGSEVFRRIISTDPKVMMPGPESHLSLTAYEKAILIKWIENGAEYQPHWAFQKPVRPAIPTEVMRDWGKNPVDRFVAARLASLDLRPAPEADRETLIRRVTFDLTGLPPTLAEIDTFLADKSADAYEKVVDRLLKSPHYGERMATDWLDVARFADSHGYTVDRLRDMSPYRDWVIRAFNRNQPYDRFIHWQLAGDLLSQANREMRIATAFNRNHPQNMEGGIIEKEFQTEYVLDRTNTLGDAFLGLSVGCAKCHDHKYDPISQKNYYQLSAFFNNVAEAGQISWDDAMPSPTLLLPTPRQQKLLEYLNTQIAAQTETLRTEQERGESDFEQWLSSHSYAGLARQTLPGDGLVAHYAFEGNSLRNEVNPKDLAYTTLAGGVREKEVWTTGHQGVGLLLNGDAWLDLDRVGIFRKSEPFSVGLWVRIPKEMQEGVIFHKSLAERLYNFRGYHVYLKDGRLEMSMAHVAPANAISKISRRTVPRDRWIQLTMTNDGSGRAAGLKLYLDGREMPMRTTMDHLDKDILFDEKRVSPQPGLQIGGWWRGYGLKNGAIDDIVVYNRTLTPYEAAILAQKTDWKAIGAKTVSQLTQIEREALRAYYFSAVHLPTRKARQELTETRTMLADSTEPVRELMVMREAMQFRPTYVLERGSYDAPGERVSPATPERIFPFPKDYPKNRYGLARWLTHPDNPLTARVAVNRYWQMFFGTGLVRTSEDFGNQGEMPSHPKLLDWLAVSFQESGWNVKQLIRTLVTSATYRQSSRTPKALYERDPNNRLLARGPTSRLTAEMLRDNALAASGLINLQVGGSSIKPYQPDGLWRINGATYVPDTGAQVYKRSLYVLIKRSVPNPTLGTFDAPSRSFCTVRRQKTNTPLQALVTLNDPTFVEAARVLGEVMSKGEDNRSALVRTYRKLTGRQPTPQEVALLLRLQATEIERFRKNPAKARGWLTTGQYRVDPSLEAARVAANTVVASTIMNSDATLTKR